MVGFLFQNPMNPIWPTKPLKEDLAYLDPLRFGEDFVVLVRFGDEIVVFAQIWAWSGVFCFNPVVATRIWRKINRSGKDPMKIWRRSDDEMEVLIHIWAWGGLSCFNILVIAQFQRKINRFGEDSAKIWRLKLTPTSTDPTVVQRSPIRLDPRLPAVGSESFNFSPDVSGSVSGWAQTQPRPTCGHPYLIVYK